MKIYLAGGMRTDWQDAFIKRYPTVEFVDPRSHGLVLAREYTFVDKLGIRQSDLVVCYFERGNPSGLGLAYEVGYADGLGIPVLLIDEKEDKYAAMLRASLPFFYSTVREAFDLLDALIGRDKVNKEEDDE